MQTHFIGQSCLCLYFFIGVKSTLPTRPSRIFDRAEVISFVKEKFLQRLVEVTRKKAGRYPNSTYAIIDSQSVDTAYKSEQVGFDGGKKDISVIS